MPTPRKTPLTPYEPSADEFIYRIPLPWMLQAMRCHVNGSKIGALLWYLAGRKRSWTVTVPTDLLHAAGMDRRALKPTLLALRAVALIRLDCHPGRMDRVTLRQLGKEKQRRNYPEPKPYELRYLDNHTRRPHPVSEPKINWSDFDDD